MTEPTTTDPTTTDLGADAARILATVRYLALATVDPDGRPRVSPVFFTRAGDDLIWVSDRQTHHSRNLAADPRADGVVYDATVPPGRGEAVYATGTAREVPEGELAERCATLSADPRGAWTPTPADVSGAEPLRMYVLTVQTWSVHVPAGHPTLGTGTDQRLAIDLDRPARNGTPDVRPDVRTGP